MQKTLSWPRNYYGTSRSRPLTNPTGNRTSSSDGSDWNKLSTSERTRSLGVEPDAETFIVDAEGETDDVEIVLNREDLESLDPGTVESLFSVDYLGDMSKAVANSKQVDLELAPEYPTKIEQAPTDLLVAGRVHSRTAPFLFCGLP
jgi:hypothetical protein